jgi:hypothetical protein
MHCATAEWTTCTLIVITANKKQVDMLRYVITVIGIISLTTREMILFHMGVSAPGKRKSGLYLNYSRIFHTQYEAQIAVDETSQKGLFQKD